MISIPKFRIRFWVRDIAFPNIRTRNVIVTTEVINKKYSVQIVHVLPTNNNIRRKTLRNQLQFVLILRKTEPDIIKSC